MHSKLTKKELLQRLEQLEKENKTLGKAKQTVDVLTQIGRLMSLESETNMQHKLFLRQISRLINVERTSMFLLSSDRMRLIANFAEGLESEDICLDLQMGLVGACVLNQKIINVANAYSDERFNWRVDEKNQFRTESVLCVPFFDRKGCILGALELLNKKTGVFCAEDERLAQKTASKLFAINFNDDEEKKLLQGLLDELGALVNSTRGAIFLLDRDKGELYPYIADGIKARDIRLSIKLGIAGYVVVTGQELIINDAYADGRFNPAFDEKTGFVTRRIACVPMRNHCDKVIGVIQAINKKKGDFADDDIEILRNLSALVAIYVENFLLLDEYRQQFFSMLEVMAASIDAKDPLTATHSQTVKKYSVGIARELGFSKADLEVLSVAALLHDYGKLGINETVLKKNGKLTPAEYDYIKTHASHTLNILDKMYFAPQYRNVPIIAASHHERLDGQGYCGGLKEENIPFMSKIITVADVFDALTAKRHYREAMSAEKAFEIIEKGIGTQFDENVVRAMKSFWAKNQQQRR